MNMNSVSVHTFNKTSVSKHGQLLLASIVISSLLTACGGSSGPSAEETAARAAVTTAQSAAAVAAVAAQVAEKAAQEEDSTAAAKAAADAAAAAKTAAQASILAAEKAAIDKSATDEADQAKLAASAAQASADKAAASSAAATQAVADKAVTISIKREEINTIAVNISKEVQAAQSARTSADNSLLQAEQQAKDYPEVAESLRQTQTYAAQSVTEAEKAVAEKTRVETIQTDAASTETVAAIQALLTQAKAAEQAAKIAREAAEKALQSARSAASQVTSEVAAAKAARRYTKIDSFGNELPRTANSWSCLKDTETGLIWEMKTDDGGSRDKDWRYKHMHNSGGYAGVTDLNGKLLCNGIFSCDPYSYIDMVNQQVGLCGKSNWRLPKMEELGSIAQINADERPPHIERSVFKDLPDAKAAYCSENMITDPNQCGYGPGSSVTYNSDGRIECNYKGVDFGNEFLPNLPHDKAHLDLSIAVALRHYGEVGDGKDYPYGTANWLCSTRLVTK